MAAARGRKQLWIYLATVLGVWMVLAVVMTGQAYLVVHSAMRAEKHLAGVRPNFAVTEIFLNSLAECTIWAFLTVGFFGLGSDFPLVRANGR